LLPKLKARKHLENKTKTRCVYSARRRDPFTYMPNQQREADPGKRAVARTPPLAAPPPRVDRPRLPCRPHAYLSTEGYVNHVDRARPPPHPHTTNVPRPPHPRASQRVTAPAEGRSFTRGTRPRAPARFRLVDAPRRRHASRGHVPAMGARHVGRIGRLRRCHTTVRGPARRPRGAWHPCSCLLYPRGTTWNANATPLALKLQNPTSERKTGEARKQQPRHFFLERSPSAAQRVLRFRRALVASLFHGRDLL
jgi:hypothetical protein